MELKKLMILVLLLLTMLAYAQSDDKISVKSTAADFVLPDINNQQIRLSDYIGKQLIIVDFWASWCSPCLRLLPELDKIHKEYDEVVVMAINIDTPRALNRAKRHIRSNRFSILSLYDTNKEVMERFQVTDIPHTFLIGLEGEIVYDHIGYTRGDEEMLVEAINQYLTDKRKPQEWED